VDQRIHDAIEAVQQPIVVELATVAWRRFD